MSGVVYFSFSAKLKQSFYEGFLLYGCTKLGKPAQGRSAADLCREYGISQPTFYKWRKQYGGMEASQAKRLRDLEEENRRLKQIR